ncbi:MAG: NUDIX hydrolase [Thermotogota bacterium]|nr:NUDIX hydrolase [Thermotogota bacterium]
MKEDILVIETENLKEFIKGNPGLKDADEKILFGIIEKNGLFKDRDTVEQDPYYKQIIPYIAMVNEKIEILTLKRLTTQSEKRLHNKISLGVGGHVNNEDSKTPLDAFKKGMQREIDEEVKVKLMETPEFLGVIYDSTTSVGQVHLGMAYKVKIEFYGINEKDKFDYTWKRTDELTNDIEAMENWSKFILKKL